MKEVSCKACGLLLEAMRRRSIPLEQLLDGLPVSLEWLQDSHNRIDWDTYVDLLARVETLCGGPQEFEQIGALAVQAPTFRSIRTLAGLFASTQQLCWVGSKWVGPSRFSHMRFEYTPLPGDRVRLVLEIPPEYRDAPQLFRLSIGVMRVVPRFLGQDDDAVIEAQITSHRAVYTITPPRPSRRARLRRALRALFAARGVIEELAEQQAQLKQSYDELQLAHRQIAAQAKQLEEKMEDSRRAEVALKQSEEHFRLLIEHGLDLIAVLNADGTIRYASPSHERLLGYQPADLIGQHVFSFVHPDDAANAIGAFSEAIQRHGMAPPVELRFRHANGSWRTIEAYGTNLIDAAGVATGIINSRDITERKQAEEKTKVLLDIAKSISGSLDLKAILDAVQRRAAQALPCDRLVTFCMGPARQGFRMIGQYGVPPEQARQIEAMVFPPGQPFGGRVMEGHTLVCNDITQQPWLPVEFCRHFEIATLAVAPLRVRDRHYGLLLAVNTSDTRPFTADQVELLEGIARQVGVALDTAELYRVQEAEAEVSGALARVGREMIASLDRPALLERLCELTIEILQCDFSHTWLWDPVEQAFIAAAGRGDPPELWEALRVLKLSRPTIAPFLARFDRDEVVNMSMSTLQPTESTSAAAPYEVTVALMAPLRVGDEIFGMHTAGYRGQQALFTPQQERIAQGIAQIASLALDHVRAIQELERANHLKSDFVATMSHELRTPLNVIIGYTDLLREGAFGDLTTDQGDILERVEHNARNLLALINETLNLSRLESGRVPVEMREIQVADLITELAAETRELRDRPGLQFAWNVAVPLPQLHTDPVKLKVVLKNLISNAVKFTELGAVTVDVQALDGGIEFRVTDTGMGIEPDAVPIIFEPFRQAGNWVTRRYGGVGLGLYIVRRLLDMLGGTVAVESAVGSGSTFRVWIPTVPVLPPATVLSELKDDPRLA